MNPQKRPLSPHLQVYRPQMTSVMSILHRMSGVALSLGTLLVVVWLVAAASGADAYNMVRGLIVSPLGMLLLFGWSVALFYHALNGVRHLFWDMGALFEIKNAYRAGYAVLIATALLTAGTWGYVFKFSPVIALSAPAASDTLAGTMIDNKENAP